MEMKMNFDTPVGQELLNEIKTTSTIEAIRMRDSIRERLLKKDYGSHEEQQAMLSALPILTGKIEDIPMQPEDASKLEGDERAAYIKTLNEQHKAAVEAGNEVEAERVAAILGGFNADVSRRAAEQVEADKLAAHLEQQRDEAQTRADDAFTEFRRGRVESMLVSNKLKDRSEIEREFDDSIQSTHARSAINKQHGVVA